MADAAPRLIEIARVAGAFGVRGEIRITAYAEDPLSLKGYGPLSKRDGSVALTLTAVRMHKGGLVVRAREVETKEQADLLRGLRLYVDRSALPEPEEDEFYQADLIGLEARDASGAVLGTVKSVQDFGAGDILEIAPPEKGPTWYLPFTRDAVPELHIAERWLLATRPEEVTAEGEARG
ncbi:MAG: ribosome maturation factor RimM [Caulobacteraceae bacterium]|nr:ribosome maturation factor RimM [Caulobacteraceae bacterium]